MSDAQDIQDGTGRLVRESGKLSLLTMISRVLGLIRERTRGSMMGTGVLADAFTVAFTVPNLFRRLFAEGSMSVAFVPTLKLYFSEGDDEKTREFLSATCTVLCLTLCGVVALGIALSPHIVGLFQSEPIETAFLMRMMFPFLALVSIAAFFQGILNAQGSFVPSGFAPILFNICFILVPRFFEPYMGNAARAMAVGVIAGGFAQAVCQVPAVIRGGARFGFLPITKALSNPGMKRVLSLIAPTIVGMAAYEINGAVSSSLATYAGVGEATALSFSLRLLELVLGVFVVSIGTVLLPELSGLASEQRWAEYRDRLIQALEVIALVTIPISVFSILERFDIVALIFKTEAFDEHSVRQTAHVFLFHMIGLPFVGAQRILAPAFYARGDTKTPAAVGIGAVAVNIAASFILMPYMGGAGIATALSIASVINAVLLMVMLSRAGIPGLGGAFAAVGKYTLRLVLFSAAAGIPVIALQSVGRYTHSSTLRAYGLPFAVSALIFAALGCALLYASKDSAALFLLRAVRRKKPSAR